MEKAHRALTGVFAWAAIAAAGLLVAVVMSAGNHPVTHSHLASSSSSCAARCTH